MARSTNRLGKKKEMRLTLEGEIKKTEKYSKRCEWIEHTEPDSRGKMNSREYIEPWNRYMSNIMVMMTIERHPRSTLSSNILSSCFSSDCQSHSLSIFAFDEILEGWESLNASDHSLESLEWVPREFCYKNVANALIILWAFFLFLFRVTFYHLIWDVIQQTIHQWIRKRRIKKKAINPLKPSFETFQVEQQTQKRKNLSTNTTLISETLECMQQAIGKEEEMKEKYFFESLKLEIIKKSISHLSPEEPECTVDKSQVWEGFYGFPRLFNSLLNVYQFQFHKLAASRQPSQDACVSSKEFNENTPKWTNRVPPNTMRVILKYFP